MKLISKLTKAYNRWRQRLDDIQHQDGRDWARKVYLEGKLSIRELLDAATPVTSAFDRGVLQAVIEIERDRIREDDRNLVGEPVGVPFMIHPSNMGFETGEMVDPVRHERQLAEQLARETLLPGEFIDPEKEKAAIEVEERQGLRTRKEQVDRRCILKAERPGWTKVGENGVN